MCCIFHLKHFKSPFTIQFKEIIRKLQSLFKFLFSCTIVNFAEMFNGAVVNIANGIIKNQNEY